MCTNTEPKTHALNNAFPLAQTHIHKQELYPKSIGLKKHTYTVTLTHGGITEDRLNVFTLGDMEMVEIISVLGLLGRKT